MLLSLFGCNQLFIPNDPIPEMPPIEPVWNSQQAIQELNALLDYGFPNPIEVIDIYQELYDNGATIDCPGSNYNFDGPLVDNAGCETENGYFFAGTAELRREDHQWNFHCDCRILSPQGELIQGAGNMSYQKEGNEIRMDIRGSWLTQNIENSEAWLNSLPSLNFKMEFKDQNALMGGYTIHGNSLFFDHFELRDCKDRNQQISWRDPSGGWWSLRFLNSCTQSELLFQNDVIETITWDSEILDHLLWEIAP